ncbi:hypothetical protein B0T14DRAFT_499964 [Immersiella caudata]|uniref:Uncharacterized protein n=1 Tax=Immersiella caudata TaxID=314043 RepID=A0AA39WG37_9PEZI|nr:hypothetical protein B0T14DRAFT_499964 [Immersiella caudata]
MPEVPGVGNCGDDGLNAFASKLLGDVEVYYEGEAAFAKYTVRWSNVGAPTSSITILPATQNDVIEIVKSANRCNMPFLACNGLHGALTMLAGMDWGITINLAKLNRQGRRQNQLQGRHRHTLGRQETDGHGHVRTGIANPRFPIYIPSYNASTQAQAQLYDRFVSATRPSSAFSGSLFMFEGCSTQGVNAVDASSSAFGFRNARLLVALLIQYAPDVPSLDAEAKRIGNELQDILH